MRITSPSTVLTSLTALLASIGAAQARGALGIKGGKVTVLTGGVEDASYSLSPPSPIAAIALDERSTLKVSFSVIDTTTGSAVQPRNAQLLFEGAGDAAGVDAGGKRGESAVQVGVKANGKGSYVLNLANTPLPFHPSPNLNLTLLLSALPSSSAPAPTPFEYHLATLSLPPSLVDSATYKQQQQQKRGGAGSTYPPFEVQDEIYPQMPAPEKEVKLVISLAGVGVVLAPWVVLLGIYSRLSPSLSLASPSPSTSLFLLSLAALEALFATYWVCLKLYHLLPALAVLGLAAGWLGKTALRASRV